LSILSQIVVDSDASLPNMLAYIHDAFA